MRTRSRARARKAPTPAPQGAGEHSSTWGSLNFDLLAQVLNAVQRLGSEDGGSGAAGRAGGLQAVRAWAAVLGVNKHWRACAQEVRTRQGSGMGAWRPRESTRWPALAQAALA